MVRDVRATCPECSAKIPLDAVGCRCGWKSDEEKAKVEVDSLGRPKRCACGNLASVIDGNGTSCCSVCAERLYFGNFTRNGPGYQAFKAVLEQHRKRMQSQRRQRLESTREPGCDDELEGARQ